MLRTPDHAQSQDMGYFPFLKIACNAQPLSRQSSVPVETAAAMGYLATGANADPSRRAEEAAGLIVPRKKGAGAPASETGWPGSGGTSASAPRGAPPLMPSTPSWARASVRTTVFICRHARLAPHNRDMQTHPSISGCATARLLAGGRDQRACSRVPSLAAPKNFGYALAHPCLRVQNEAISFHSAVQIHTQ